MFQVQAANHFAHAQGHLQLVSLEFLPLFAWLWWSFLERPGYRLAAAAAAALLGLILCDYYYFVYAVLLGALLFIARMARTGWDRSSQRAPLGPLLAFVAIAGATSGAIAIAMLSELRGGVVGAHNAENYSLDLLALLIPGGHWRFAELTEVYWRSTI